MELKIKDIRTISIIPLGAMHPEHQDPEAEILWMRQPGIKGINFMVTTVESTL